MNNFSIGIIGFGSWPHIYKQIEPSVKEFLF